MPLKGVTPLMDHPWAARHRSAGLEELWFAGVHADVGGTFEPDHKLATVALTWVTDGAIADLNIDPKRYAELCSDSQTFASGSILKKGPLWILAGLRKRPMPSSCAVLEGMA